jgi:hypothetical protein
MEQRIAFLQQQIKAEKAKGSHGVPTTQALSRPSSFPTVPQQHQKQEPEILFDPFAPTPTSSTSALFPSTAHLDHPTTSLPQMQMPLPTAQPAQPNSRAKQQQQQPLQQPTPTMMDDYERLFNNVPFSLSSSSQSTVPQSPLHTAQSKQQQPMEQQQQRQQQQQKHKQPQGPNPEEAACLAEYEQLFNNVPLPTSSSSAQPQISAALPVPSSKASTSSSSLHSKAPGAGAAPAASPALPPPDMIPDITPISSSSKGGSGGKYDFDQVKEYVTELYRVYTGGKLPDPATFRWYIESIMNGSYSLAQAEYSIRYSKAAKEFAKQKQQKEAQLHEYVRELMRVYCKRAPTDEEMKRYANGVLSGQCKLYSHHILLGSFSRSAVCRTDNLQQVEDEIKLLGMVRRSGGGERPAGHTRSRSKRNFYICWKSFTQ